MGHEITVDDKLVLHQTPAWHGLGLVLPDALTPTEACELVFPWTAEERNLFYTGNGKKRNVTSHKLLVRSDTQRQLGLVSANYQTVQPCQMAEFCEALGEVDKTVTCETAGSVRGGRKIWYLLKGESFEIGNGDEVFSYVLVSNGFDGLTTFRVTPTTIRVVCKNTLHSVVPDFDKGNLRNSAIAIRHTVNALERIEEAKKALKMYHTTQAKTREVFETLAAADVDTKTVQQFFIDAYQEDFGAIPANPKNGHEENRRERAKSAYRSFIHRFDDEKAIAGANLWNAANAYSGLVQHDRKARGKDDANRVERRVYQNLFGLNQDRAQNGFKRAFRLAVSG